MTKNIKMWIITLFFVIFTSQITQADDSTINENKAQDNHSKEYYTKQIDGLFDIVCKDYVEPPEKQQMIDAAIKGMLQSLDPHSYYFIDEELSDFMNQTEGHFGGIGVEITYEEGLIKVISPIDDLPADKVGIKPGDYIVYVDDESVKTLGFYKSVKKMRGKEGTKVKLTIARDGENKPLEFTLIRDIVKIQSVKYRDENDIAYVRISTVNENTTNELKQAFVELRKNKNLEGIILDLRNNGGGLLDQAIKVSEYFIESGKIVSTKGRHAAKDATFNSNVFADKAPKLTMVTLINSGSASASEIVAGALQDHARSIILGTKSFGKGSVQSIFRIDQRSAMKITTAKYYTPNGRSIQAEGIQPDIFVEMAKVEYSNPEDEEKKKVFEKSYSNHLKGEKELTKEQDTKITTPPSNEKKIDQLSDIYKKDYQYARAFDLIKALNIAKNKDLIKNK